MKAISPVSPASQSPLRLIVDATPGSGAWNMAVDETLLETAISADMGTLRLYSWSVATLSLGYFQNADDAREAVNNGLSAVRRLSGGGAILHHHEVTYSCTLPASHVLARQPHLLYDVIHLAFIDSLQQRGIPAELRGDDRAFADKPFLCFGRGDAHDVVLNGSKILGSAQRRRKGAVLQHGSLLLQRSPHAPLYPGLVDLAPAFILDQSFLDEVTSRLRIALPIGDTAENLTKSELHRANTLETERYRTLSFR